MKLYKLTEQDNTTYCGSTLWGKNVTHKLPKINNPQLCSNQVLHAYKNKNLAFLLNPIHANINNPILWQAEGEIAVSDFGKVACFELTTIKKLKLPSWINTDKENKIRIMFAVICAESVLQYYENKYPDDKRVRRAIEVAKEYLNNSLKGSAYAAYAAAHAAYAAHAAAYAAADAAAYAAHAAAYAAYAAAYAADVAADAADAAADAADAAAHAAAYDAAVHAAHETIDFGKIADKAVKLVIKGHSWPDH